MKRFTFAVPENSTAASNPSAPKRCVTWLTRCAGFSNSTFLNRKYGDTALRMSRSVVWGDALSTKDEIPEAKRCLGRRKKPLEGITTANWSHKFASRRDLPS